MQDNWATLWETVGDAMPDRIALVAGDRRVTYREFDERAAKLAGALTALGLGTDAKVGVLAYNCAEYAETIYAAFKLRGTPVNLNYRYRDDELVEVLDDSDTEVLFFHGALGELVGRVRSRLPRVTAFVQIDDGSPRLDGSVDYEDFLAGGAPMPRIERSGEDVFLIYTGGTTGRPRGVMWRHQDIITTLAFPAYTMAGLPTPTTAAEVATAALDLVEKGAAPTFLPASPMVHGTAYYLAKAAWLLGGTVLMHDSRHFDADELWRLVETEQVDQIAIVGDPFARPMVQALERAEAEGRPYDLSRLRRVTSSGAAWSLPWKQGLADRATVMLADMMGASEGGPFSLQVIPPGATAEGAPFTMGPRAKLLREDGTEIPPESREQGVLAVTEPFPLGYYKDPAKTAELLRDFDGRRYCMPGDHAYRDDNGEVVLLGRGALCINTAGEKVFTQEVEEVLLATPGIFDAVLVGVPDDTWGNAVTALVQTDPARTVSVVDVQDAVRVKLSGYKVPKHVVFVDEIVRSPTGKARYDWARETAREAVAGTAGR